MPLAPTRIIPITRKALYFDGIDDYAESGIVLDPNSDFTVIVMFKAYRYGNGAGDIAGIVTERYGYAAARAGFDLRLTSTGYLQTALSDGANLVEIQSPNEITLNEWYIAGARRNGGVLDLIVNGSVVNSADVSALGTISVTEPLRIARYGNPNLIFQGEIPYVIVYARALSDDEIQQIYNDPDHPPKSGLVLWLHDTSIDTENNVWRDLSGNGNDATIYGATAVDVVRPATRVLDATRVIEPTR